MKQISVKSFLYYKHKLDGWVFWRSLPNGMIELRQVSPNKYIYDLLKRIE